MSTTLRITIREYDKMIRQGAFDALRDRRIELVQGELRGMTPPGPKHEDVVDILPVRMLFENLSGFNDERTRRG